MAKVTIKRRNDYEKADGTAALYIVLFLERQKIRIPLDISVTSKEWDAAKERVKGNSPEARDKNLIIANTLAHITEILVKARLLGDHLTKEGFLATYHDRADAQNYNDFAARHLREISPAMQPQTVRHHKAALKKLRQYNSALRLRDITSDWLRVYAAHLRDELGNSPGTIRKNMSVIRMHLFAAIRAGLLQSNPFEGYRLPSSRPVVSFLTEDELNQMIALYDSAKLSDNEIVALRFFLFMAFTGMHITDARLLRHEQIFGGEIHYTRIKTRTQVSVPVSGPAAKLIEYFSEGRKRGNLFRNLPTDQAFNRLIKRVASIAGITKNVSAKTARHTFATMYYKKNSGDLGTLSKLLGHTSVATTMIYTHILKNDRVKGVAAFDGML